MASKNNSSNDNNGLGCVLTLIAIVFAMPLVGLYLLTKDNQDDKAAGLVLLILGICIWIALLINMK